MKSKESVEYSYKWKRGSVPISLNVMPTWHTYLAEKCIFGIALRAPKGIHSSAIIHKHFLNRFLPQIDS